MATTTEAIETTARITGKPLAVVDRIARAMKAAVDANNNRRDLWGIGGVGGGKRAAQVEAHHLRNLYLALIASQPSDVVQVIDDLCEWRLEGGTRETVKWVSLPSLGAISKMARGASGSADALEIRKEITSEPSPTVSDGMKLGDWLQSIIETLAKQDAGARQEWVSLFAGTSIAVNVEGGYGWVAAPILDHPESKHITKFRAPEAGLGPAEGVELVERIVTVPLRYLATAADLLADTWAKRRDDIFSPPGEAKASAEPENENAPDPGRSEADTRKQDQPRDDGNRDTIDTPENMAERAISQGRKLSRAGLRDHPMPEARVA